MTATDLVHNVINCKRSREPGDDSYPCPDCADAAPALAHELEPTAGWYVGRCLYAELPRELRKVEAQGYERPTVLLEHSEYTIIAYMSRGERERRRVEPLA